MQKYKEDLDQTSIPRRDRSITNPNYTSSSSNAKNEFNLQLQNSHNPLVNPLPFNIQNPYILRQMNRGSQYHEEQLPSKPYWYLYLNNFFILFLFYKWPPTSKHSHPCNYQDGMMIKKARKTRLRPTLPYQFKIKWRGFEKIRSISKINRKAIGSKDR